MNVFLSFSDAAKFADIARNLVQGFGYTTSFTFWSGNVAQWISPVMPYSIAALFKIFGVSDFAVIAASGFYFILTLIFVFLLAKKVFGTDLIAWLSTAAVGFNYDLIHYGLSGASESPFIFEIVAVSYFVSLRKKWGNAITAVLLAFMYFTRPQAIIYILGIIIYFLFVNFSWKKATIFSFGALLFGSGLYILFSRQGASAITQNLSGITASDSLRGGLQVAGFSEIIKKFFYNLYNFYKLIPQIINPYLFALFMIGIFRWKTDKTQSSFKIASIFMLLATFVATALTIPFFRYIHPIIPLVYIIGVDTLIWILAQISKGRNLIVTSSVLVLFLVIGQTLGIFLLDSRFERNAHNVDKPPVYVQLSYLLRSNTEQDQILVTNLDTWGSWYGERKTVWFPLEPKQLIDSTGKIPFDAIYLTSYLMDDPNYYMGSDWREIFNNPRDSKKWTCDGCDVIAKEFTLKGIYKVPTSEDYERQDDSAILLIKR